MTVYVLFKWVNDYDEVEGIYTTLAKAMIASGAPAPAWTRERHDLYMQGQSWTIRAMSVQ